MIQQQKVKKRSNPLVSPFVKMAVSPTSSFLGIGEGKSKAAKAAAAAQAAASELQAKLTEAMMQLAGANVAKQNADAEAVLLAAKANAESSVISADSGTNLYLIIGGIVLVLMGGLYFILKARRK